MDKREFNEATVLQLPQQVEYLDIRIHRQPCPKFGTLWPQGWGLPISAR